MSSTEDSSVTWLESIRRYVLGPDAKILDLHDLNLNGEEFESILEYLAGSDICELDFSNNRLTNQMASLSKLLIRTKIRKLNMSKCELSRFDIMSLMRILKDFHINDLNISGNWFELPNPESNEFISYLAESHLTSLNLGESAEFTDVKELLHLIRVLCRSSITHLNLDYLNIRGSVSNSTFSDAIMTLFHHLGGSAVTHLSLALNRFDFCSSFTLGDGLRKSKLIELDLSRNGLKDLHIEELSKALIGTQITSLNLSQNRFRGLNHLFRYLKETQIRRLDISSCVIYDDTVFDFPEFLSGISVVSLNLHGCHLPESTEVKIIKFLKPSKLEELGLCYNYVDQAAVLEFCQAVTETSVTSVNFGRISSDSIKIDNFFGLLKNSDVKSLKLTNLGLRAETAKIASPNFGNSKLTHLDLGSNLFGGNLQSLAGIFKFTAINDLNLAKNWINDNDAEVLAACLKETRLVTLNLSRNEITDCGAEFLALSLEGTGILSLNLEKNKIGNPGMEVLAKYAATTLITALKVGGNPGNRRLVETVTWNNWKSVLEIARCFKQIAPEPGMNAFRFEVNTTDVDTFLDEFLSFYDLSMKHPSLPLVLSHDANISLGQEQIAALLFEEFPRQFAQFIATKIEAEISEHICFLKKVEEMGLTRIVEHLLLNRPVYTIDRSHGILHAYVYQLLNKYKLPICNLDIEPLGIERIIEYFTEFSNIEGATEVIRMLRCI